MTSEYRLMTSWDTEEEDIKEFVRLLSKELNKLKHKKKGALIETPSFHIINKMILLKREGNRYHVPYRNWFPALFTRLKCRK